MELYKQLKDEKKFFLIAGPCVIEDKHLMLQIAEDLKKITSYLGIQFIFKSSYKKANRTSINSPTGVGLQKGLKLLKKIKREFDVPILTDVHETNEVDEVAQVADIIQIPAFLSRQTELLLKSCKSQKIVNIKKGQFMAPEDMRNVAKKVLSTENNKILLTERGTIFGYHNLVVDFRSFAILKSLGYPVIYDVTHSLQKPSIGKVSGGSPEYVSMMAKAALATGMVDGLFIETHPNPQNAFSDANSMLPLCELKELLKICFK